MSLLSGAKLIVLNNNGEHEKIIKAKGRQLTIGHYASCDYPISHPTAEGVHCEINCDAFGRVR